MDVVEAAATLVVRGLEGHFVHLKGGHTGSNGKEMEEKNP